LNLFAANAALREWQWSLLHINDAQQAETVKAEELAVINTENLPAGGLKARQQKLDFNPAETRTEQNLADLRLLCIRAEILAGATTPAADQALRMEYQGRQLEQNFGQKPVDLRVAMDELVFEWL